MDCWGGLDEFVVIAEIGQFVATAERIGTSSSRISRQVTRLEERLQTRLLHRSTRRVPLSEAGQTFLQHCQRLQNARDEALRTVNDPSAEPRGLLHMTCTVAHGECSIVPLVNTLMTDYPQLWVDIELSNRQPDLLRGGLDPATRPGRLNGPRLVVTRSASRVMYLCATPEYLRRHDTLQLPTELSQFNCLIGNSDLWSFLKDGREIQHRVQGNWRHNNGQAVLNTALRSFGLYQLPDCCVIEHLHSDCLVSLLEGHQLSNIAVWALYPQQRHLSPKVRQLADHLKEGLAQSHPGLIGEKNLR